MAAWLTTSATPASNVKMNPRFLARSGLLRFGIASSLLRYGDAVERYAWHRIGRRQPVRRGHDGARSRATRELKAKLDRKEPFVLVDVREPYEYEICHIPGSRLIPLGELPARLSELDSADDIVLQCKSGARSARALHILQEAGFKKLSNLEGGIVAWAEQVDPSVPKY
jgi:rhodanese-related sulfurtransferase